MQFSQEQLRGQDAHILELYQCPGLSEPCDTTSCRNIAHQFVRHQRFSIKTKVNTNGKTEVVGHEEKEFIWILCPRCVEQFKARAQTKKDGPTVTIIWREEN
jgi:hypothetical protein